MCADMCTAAAIPSRCNIVFWSVLYLECVWTQKGCEEYECVPVCPLAPLVLCSNTYSALNALAGHYNSFGATAPIPKKRLERLTKVRTWQAYTHMHWANFEVLIQVAHSRVSQHG